MEVLDESNIISLFSGCLSYFLMPNAKSPLFTIVVAPREILLKNFTTLRSEGPVQALVLTTLIVQHGDVVSKSTLVLGYVLYKSLLKHK